MPDRYIDIRDGLHTVYATVLAPDQVLRFEPTMVTSTPLLFSTLATYSREGSGPIQHRYDLYSYLVVAYQHPAGAEQALEVLIDPLIDAVDADPKLGGVLNASGQRYGGQAWVSSVVTGFLRIGSILCRSFQITTTVEVKELRP